MSQYLLIDSINRDVLEPNYNFTVQFKNNIKIQKYIKLIYASIPITNYNLNLTNNKLRINNTNIFISIGSYDSTTLATELKNMLVIAFPLNNFNVSYIDKLFKYNITGTNPFTLNLSQSTINIVLGFGKNDITNNNIISDYAANLLGPNYLSVKLSGIENNIKSNAKTNLGFIIPLTVNEGGISYFNSKTNYPQKTNVLYELNFISCNIQLLLPDNSFFDNNNIDWVLLFEYE